ncbi:MAG: SBBP repeat-containing protein, partial [Limisphaerales bacterium]
MQRKALCSIGDAQLAADHVRRQDVCNLQQSTNRSRVPGFVLAVLAALAFTVAIPNRLNAAEPSPALLWVQQSDGSGQKEGFGVAVDPQGNLLVAGGFTDSSSFGTHNVSSIGGMDLVLAKYDRTGQCLWAIQAGSTNGPGPGSSGDVAYQVITDPQGNSYFTGYFTGTAFFGSTNITSLGFNDIYLAKSDPSGNLLWVRRAGSANNDSGINLKVDSTGNVYVTGFFRSVADFGGVTLTSTNGAPIRSDLFLVKYDSSGNTLWARQAGGSGDDVGYDIAIGAEHVYLTGYFQNTATFGSTNLTSSGSSDIFLAKYTTAGELVWVTKAGGTQGDVARAIGLDASENIYITGRFGG